MPAAPRVFYGLLPPSISHEGYSAKPMHSYWDDFCALHGLEGRGVARARRWATPRTRRSFGALARRVPPRPLASIARAMAAHRIDYIPGSAELGDFDATSTTIALAPGGELRDAAARRACDRDVRALLATSSSRGATARSVGRLHAVRAGAPSARFVRLGQQRARARAAATASSTTAGRRRGTSGPRSSGATRATPKFIGDMPHTWVASDFIRSVLDMFAYERDRRRARGRRRHPGAVGAISRRRARERAAHIVRHASTCTMFGGGRRREMFTSAEGFACPPAGSCVHSPYDRRSARDRRTASAVPMRDGHAIVIHALPADIVLRPLMRLTRAAGRRAMAPLVRMTSRVVTARSLLVVRCCVA